MQTSSVHYTIEASKPHAHIYSVTCTVKKPSAKQVFTLPAWIPGSYKIRDFAKHLIQIKARDKKGDVAIEQLDKASWCVKNTQGSLTLEYEVYAWDLSVRGAHLDASHGFFNGSSVFLAVSGQEAEPCTVDILKPAFAAAEKWEVATALETSKPRHFGRYRANDYDELIDSPVEMGNLQWVSFEVKGVPHDMAFLGKFHADLERVKKDMKKICTAHVKLFGSLPEMKRYVFMTNVLGEGYGGLEHRTSCALHCSRYNLPRYGAKDVTDEYATFLSLCSHEYFHTWNIKRIKPAVFLPYDLTREAYTEQLWVFEGFTSYYEDIALVRSGVITHEQFLSMLAEKMASVIKGPGSKVQSVSESSFNAWTKFYDPNENSPNALVSYYSKGALIALCIDAYLRKHANSDLDTLLRSLWENFGQPLVGVPEGEIEARLLKLGGHDLKKQLHTWVHEAKPLPLKESLAVLGVDMRFEEQEPILSALGLRMSTTEKDKIAVCYTDGAAMKAGLSAGDTLVAVNSIAVSKNPFNRLFEPYKKDDVLTIHAFRRDELFETKLTLGAPTPEKVVLTLNEKMNTSTQRIHNAWIGQP